MYSHCELSLPSAGDQLSELDHFVDGSEFLTRDLSRFEVEKYFILSLHFARTWLLYKDKACWPVVYKVEETQNIAHTFPVDFVNFQLSTDRPFQKVTI